MSFLKKLFGPKTDYKALILAGAKVIDVRTRAEFAQGHYKGSINIPLDELPKKLSNLKKEDVIITCCRSGMRSSNAKNILKSAGFAEVHNGGPWTSLPK